MASDAGTLIPTLGRGSEWRIWDLHVHTPASMFHHYTGEDIWDRYLSELSQLAAEVKVLGINDYWFLDGYKRVRTEFELGNLPNLDAVFPVIETRCDTFGGVNGNLRRLNLHFIVDPLLPPELIETQLVGTLRTKFKLSNEHPHLEWSEVITPDSIERLGAKIRESVPDDKLKDYGTDLAEGFNSLCVPFSDTLDSIADNTALREHVLIGVGKTEWESIKWQNQSIATKKTILNRADIVFTAAATREAFHKSFEALTNAKVTSTLFDCSDAHHWTDSPDKDRLGNVFTWVNADPTFKGLRHALREYGNRVTVDPRPAVLTRIATTPHTVVDSITIQGTSAAANLFSVNLPLNAGFTAVVGNKGQGKSALLDVAAAVANSDRRDDFSFLSRVRFLSDGGASASGYTGEVLWADGTKTMRTLDAPFDASAPVQVDYLPQQLIERVCASDPNSLQRRQFETEIERVIFRHIPRHERGASTSLDHLLATKQGPLKASLAAARGEVLEESEKLCTLELRLAELRSMDLDNRHNGSRAAIHDLDQRIADLRAKLVEAQSTATDEARAIALRADTLATAREARRVEREDANGDIAAAIAAIDRATSMVETLDAAIDDSQSAANSLASIMSIPAGELLQVAFDRDRVEAWIAAQRGAAATLRGTLDGPDGLDARLVALDAELARIRSELGAHDAIAADLVTGIADLEDRRANLIGEPADSGTLLGIEALIEQRNQLPVEIATTWEALDGAYFRVHSAILSLRDVQLDLYSGATAYVASNPLTATVELEFDVELRERGFIESWIDLVNRQRVPELLDSEHDGNSQLLHGAPLDDAALLLERLKEILDRLKRTGGASAGTLRPLEAIMRRSHEPSELLAALFELKWLESQYIIRSAGSELTALSPGQRGLVLLMFYLLVDISEKPLLLDQPEENLDNQTVRRYLVPALRDAIGRRQVIVVTHNPNLAIVGDADQIVIAAYENESFRYRSGSLAEFLIGSRSIDILEGTREAFNNREVKYDEVVGSHE